MIKSERKIFFENYFESIFEESNPLTEKQFEGSSLRFDNEIGQFMPKNLDAEMLDVGCGCGHFLYYLKKRGFKNYHGIDISAQQVKYCKENITNRVEVADTFEFLKNKNNKYDFIALNAVLEHIPQNLTVDLLKLLHNSLKVGGYLLIEVPNMSNLFSMDLRYKDFTHEAGFTEVSLRQVLILAKFSKIYFTSSHVIGTSLKNRLHRFLVKLLHKYLRFLYYIQGYSVPGQMGKLLIAVATK